jgi:hypothetical protein
MRLKSLNGVLALELRLAPGTAHMVFGNHPCLTERIGVYEFTKNLSLTYLGLNRSAAICTMMQKKIVAASIDNESTKGRHTKIRNAEPMAKFFIEGESAFREHPVSMVATNTE